MNRASPESRNKNHNMTAPSGDPSVVTERRKGTPPMKTTEWKPRWSGMAATAVLLLALTAGFALAAVPTTTDHRNATQPMITGTAMLVNEHQLLVNTEQGEEVLLTLDSRSMVPADLSAGMMMRVEFKYLDDGTRYAERVIPIRGGQKVTRELAYSTEQESDHLAASYASTTPDESQGGTMTSNAATVTKQPLDTPLRPIPATQAYMVATEPMIAGRVSGVNDHKLVVDSDQGHPVAIEMDTRTIIPTDLQSGMPVRVEYRSMENGTKLATRIVPLDQYEGMGRDMAYSDNDNTAVTADNENMSSTDMAYADTDNGAGEGQVTSEPGTPAPDNEPSNDEGRLPQTASSQPLIGLIGLLALSGAAFLAYRRRHAG